MRPSTLATLLWYLLFGLLHELSHLVAAVWVGLFTVDHTNVSTDIFQRFFTIIFQRRWEISISTSSSSMAVVEEQIHFVHHVGWIFSLIIAAGAYVIHSHNNNNISKNKTNPDSNTSHPLTNPLVWAAVITALEAISTDLFGLEKYVLPLFPLLNYDKCAHDESEMVLRFFCGNFGLILLNPAYTTTESGRKTALDILEKMISVTMVRGAQSGELIYY